MIKKKVLCNKIIHDLVNLALLSCDENECKITPLELRLAALRCLENIGNLNTKKLYIPGESKELERIRNFFISQGALMAILVLSKKAVEEEVRKTAEKAFSLSIDTFDWENQISILQSFKQYQEERRPNLITNFVRGNPQRIISEAKTEVPAVQAPETILNESLVAEPTEKSTIPHEEKIKETSKIQEVQEGQEGQEVQEVQEETSSQPTATIPNEKPTEQDEQKVPDVQEVTANNTLLLETSQIVAETNNQKEEVSSPPEITTTKVSTILERPHSAQPYESLSSRFMTTDSCIFYRSHRPSTSRDRSSNTHISFPQ